MAKRRQVQAVEERHYDESLIVDAPEHHEYSRAMGVLTWSTWDHGTRPVAQRVAEFVRAYPPTDPVKCVPGGSLVRTERSQSFAPPGTVQSRLTRFLATDWRPGSIYELLSRYGLKIAGATPIQVRPFEPGSLRDTTRKRNIRLRVLHGGVDIEPENMDAAKAEYLERQEQKQAAEQVRSAVKKMREELAGDSSEEQK